MDSRGVVVAPGVACFPPSARPRPGWHTARIVAAPPTSTTPPAPAAPPAEDHPAYRSRERGPRIDERPHVAEDRVGKGQADPEQGPHRQRERVRERVAASRQPRRNEYEKHRRRRGVRARDAPSHTPVHTPDRPPGHWKQPPPRGLDGPAQCGATEPDDDEERHRHRRRTRRLEEPGRQQQDEAALSGVSERRGRRGGKGESRKSPRKPLGGDAARRRHQFRAGAHAFCQPAASAASYLYLRRKPHCKLHRRKQIVRTVL